MKALLVDDSMAMRRILKNHLAEIGVTDTLEAADGFDALTVLKANMPLDLILLDWNMPGMNGLDFLKTVRADNKYRDVRIVMCTSEGDKLKVVEAIKAGATNYVVKPFTSTVLRQKIGLV